MGFFFALLIMFIFSSFLFRDVLFSYFLFCGTEDDYFVTYIGST